MKWGRVSLYIAVINLPTEYWTWFAVSSTSSSCLPKEFLSFFYRRHLEKIELRSVNIELRWRFNLFTCNVYYNVGPFPKFSLCLWPTWSPLSSSTVERSDDPSTFTTNQCLELIWCPLSIDTMNSKSIWYLRPASIAPLHSFSLIPAWLRGNNKNESRLYIYLHSYSPFWVHNHSAPQHYNPSI